jgi:hypothetical protein
MSSYLRPSCPKATKNLKKIIWVTNVLQVSQRVDGNAERRIQTPETVDARSARY